MIDYTLRMDVDFGKIESGKLKMFIDRGKIVIFNSFGWYFLWNELKKCFFAASRDYGIAISVFCLYLWLSF